jgi:hypothetical protein
LEKIAQLFEKLPKQLPRKMLPKYKTHFGTAYLDENVIKVLPFLAISSVSLRKVA